MKTLSEVAPGLWSFRSRSKQCGYSSPTKYLTDLIFDATLRDPEMLCYFACKSTFKELSFILKFAFKVFYFDVLLH